MVSPTDESAPPPIDQYFWPHKSSTTLQLENALGMELFPWQRDVLETWNTSKLLIKGARRASKSTLALFLSLREAWSWGRTASLLTASAGQAKLLAQQIKRQLPAREITQQSELTFGFQTGGKLRIASRFCRECAQVKQLVVDDAAFCQDPDLEEQIAAHVGRGARVLLISSWPYTPDDTLFGRLWRYGGLAWQRVEVPSEINPDIIQITRNMLEENIHVDLLRTPQELGIHPTG